MTTIKLGIKRKDLRIEDFSTEKIKEFHSKYNKKTVFECWNWNGAKNKFGYGSFYCGTNYPAHRVAYALEYKSIDPWMSVLHSCDNPSCVNPNHMTLGTYSDNNRDKKRKGRSHVPKGENNPRAKLTWEKVREIRTLYHEGITQKELANKFNKPRSTIHNICFNLTWKE